MGLLMESPSKTLIFLVASALLLAVLAAGCAAPAEGPEKPAQAPAVNATLSPAAQLCAKDGFRQESGFCVFPNGKSCAAWEYFTGLCGPNGTGQPALAQEGEFCGGIAAFRCASGLECDYDGNYPDAGGTCVRSMEFFPCDGNRGSACASQYEPACGRTGNAPSTYSYADYSSPCVACSENSPAGGYFRGSCKENGFQANAGPSGELEACPSLRNEMCAQIYDPVCGRIVSGTSDVPYYQNFPSPCDACSTASNAIAYYPGTCEDRKLPEKLRP